LCGFADARSHHVFSSGLFRREPDGITGNYVTLARRAGRSQKAMPVEARVIPFKAICEAVRHKATVEIAYRLAALSSHAARNS